MASFNHNLHHSRFMVHDWIDAYGGAETISEAIYDLINPDKFFTLIANKNSDLYSKFKNKLVVSKIQKIPGSFYFHRLLLQYYPSLIEQFDLRGANTIISSSHCVAKGVLTRSDQLHLCYIHTPPRYLWDQAFEYEDINHMSFLKKWYARRVFHKIRQWDVISSNRPSLYLANSTTVARRVWSTYRRPSIVLFPFVNLEKLRTTTAPNFGDYFVTLGRLVSQKRIDLAVRACQLAGIKLKIIGSGPELKKLQKISDQHIEFLGNLPFDQVIPVIQNSRGLIFPNEEDFGIVPLEAQALGVPVLAYGVGGAQDTVIAGKTGDFFYEQNPDDLAKKIKRWDPSKYNKADFIKNTSRFSKSKFDSQFLSILTSAEDAFSKEKVLDDVTFIKKYKSKFSDPESD